jgi:hypothetical protein
MATWRTGNGSYIVIVSYQWVGSARRQNRAAFDATASEPASGLAGVMPLEINRAPVLTLWAAVVAERLGHPAGTALTLGRAVAGIRRAGKGPKHRPGGAQGGSRYRQARAAVHRIRAAKSAAKASSDLQCREAVTDLVHVLSCVHVTAPRCSDTWRKRSVIIWTRSGRRWASWPTVMSPPS